MTKIFLSSAILLLGVASLPLMGAEYAVLASGLRLRVERHQQEGAVVRLYSHEGVTELPAAAISEFVIDDYVPPPVMAAPRVEAPPAAPTPQTLVRDAAARTGLPPAFVESVARVESGLRADALSSKGAIGVMQLMPATARALDADPYDTAQNVDAGARLLRKLLLKYDGDVVKALSAYNAGEGAVARYRGMPPYAETQDYVDKVIRAYRKAGGH